MPRKPKPPTCEDCYFRKNSLCALELNEACTTFRANRPEGLVPPRQPVLLMRAPLGLTSRLAHPAGHGALCLWRCPNATSSSTGAGPGT